MGRTKLLNTSTHLFFSIAIQVLKYANLQSNDIRNSTKFLIKNEEKIYIYLSIWLVLWMSIFQNTCVALSLGPREVKVSLSSSMARPAMSSEPWSTTWKSWQMTLVRKILNHWKTVNCNGNSYACVFASYVKPEK